MSSKKPSTHAPVAAVAVVYGSHLLDEGAYDSLITVTNANDCGAAARIEVALLRSSASVAWAVEVDSLGARGTQRNVSEVTVEHLGLLGCGLLAL